MAGGPVLEDDKDNIYKDANLEITIRDRGKGKKVVEDTINSSKNSMSESLTSYSGDFSEVKGTIEKN